MAGKFRVVLLTQWLEEPPMTGLQGRFISALEQHGMSVEVVTGPPFAVHSSQVRPGYKWWRSAEDAAGSIPIHRYPFYPGHSSSSLERVLLYGTFAAATSTRAQRHFRQADVVLVYSTPATAATAAMVAARTHGTPYVLMVQDVWPDSIFASGFLTGRARPIAEGLTGRFVDSSYRMATRLTTLSPGMRRLLMSRGVPGDKIDVVYNWADERLYGEQLTVPERVGTEPLHILYAGNLGPAQGLDAVIDTLSRFAEGSVRLSLAGDGIAEPRLRALADSMSGCDIRFLGRLSPADLRHVQETAHLHLVSLRDDPLFRITLPSKTQTLMCAGAPILAFAPGEVAQLIEASGAGVAALPGDRNSLEVAIRQALEWPASRFIECGRLAREHYFTQMAAEVNGQRLAATLRRAAEEGAHTPRGEA